MSDEVTVVTAYRCLSCEQIADEAGGPLYECSRCGTIFTAENSADGGSNRCPTDNIFGAKLADASCVNCEEGEVEEVEAIEIDGELFALDTDDTSPQERIDAAKRERDEAKRSEREREQRERDEQEAMRLRYLNAPTKRVSDLQVGDYVYIAMTPPDGDVRLYRLATKSWGGEHMFGTHEWSPRGGFWNWGLTFGFDADKSVKYDPDPPEKDGEGVGI